MSLRSKIIGYFVALHVVLAAFGVVLLIQNRVLLLIAEGLFLISLVISYRLVRALFVPLDLIRTGAELISERDFASRFIPVGQPEMDGLIRVYNEMIDRLRDERLAAQERHQLLEKLVHASPSGIVLCDFDGRVEQMNPSAARLLDSSLPDEVATMLPGESRLITRGSRRLKVWRSDFRDRGFAKSFFLVEELTEDLRLSEKAAYEKLIRMISHEVNNSVGAVRSILESMRRYAGQVRDEDRDDYTTAVEVASSRMRSLGGFVNGFADVVRIPAPVLRPESVGDMMASLLALVRPELEDRRITAQFSRNAEATVRADRHQLEQVLLNVLRNAMESIGTGGRIDVTLNDDSLTIADSGAGIAGDVLSELFTPFFTTKREGRGLGLTIVQEILTNHGFAYSLQNRAEGGAEFTIRF